MSRAQYCEQSTFDWRRYSHWKLEVEKARLAAFLLCGSVRTRPMLVKPVLLPPRCRPRPMSRASPPGRRKAGSQTGLSQRYIRIAQDWVTVRGFPPGPPGSIRVGMRAVGLIFK